MTGRPNGSGAPVGASSRTDPCGVESQSHVWGARSVQSGQPVRHRREACLNLTEKPTIRRARAR